MSLRDWRTGLGLTQRQLCKKAGTTGVSYLESHGAKPTERIATKLCKAISKIVGYQVYRWDVWPEHYKPLPIKRDDQLHATTPQEQPAEPQCETCGGSGRMMGKQAGQWYDWGSCPDCNGTGKAHRGAK